jgi:ArsR family transcriptional regulator
VLAAGANVHRLMILHLLARSARTTAELAGLVGITASAISQHLKTLGGAQLVQKQRRGREVFYALRRSGRELERLLAAVPEILH